MLTYDQLHRFDGQTFYIRAPHNPAIQQWEESGITVTYPSGQSTFISRRDIETVMRRLLQNKYVTRTELLDIPAMNRLKGAQLSALLVQLTHSIRYTLGQRTLHYQENAKRP